MDGRFLSAIAVATLLAGCVETAPGGADETPPDITLRVLNASGDAGFSTYEGPEAPIDACVFPRQFPANLIISVGDAGGISLVNVHVFPARIVPGSVSVGPSAPATSHEITATGGAADLTIRVATPGDGLVRTGVVTTLDVTDGGTGAIGPTAITVDAVDVAGNAASLWQVDIQKEINRDIIVCRNSQ